ncbi:16282_t:CDS:1, partial [Dentiscutata heterogama]
LRSANSTGAHGLYPTILIAAPDARRLGTLSGKCQSFFSTTTFVTICPDASMA